MSKKLTWLHISDIHFHPHTRWRGGAAETGLIKHLKTVFGNDSSLHPDFVFCTGDIAYGESNLAPLIDQYKDAKNFFNELLAACGRGGIPLSSERLFVVPGNHDVNRNNFSKDSQLVMNLWAKDASKHANEMNQRFDGKDEAFKSSIKRLDEYAQFLKEYLPHQHDAEGRHCYAKIIDVDGLKVGIAGFNSAWTCAGPEKERDIWLPAEWQFNAANNDLNGSEVRIGLMHHPLDWLNVADRDIAMRRISTDFDFWLHGHSHNAWIDPGQNHITIGAGALGAENNSEFGINLIQIEIPSSKGVARLYQRKRGDKGWTPAPVDGHAPEGIWQFNLPERLRKAVSPAPTASSPQAPAKEPFDLWAKAYKEYLSEKAHKTFDPELLVSQKASRIFATNESRDVFDNSSDEDVVRMMSDASYAGGDASATASAKSTAFAVLQKNPRVILEAGTGAGKTTCALSFCVEQNKDRGGDERRLALYLNLHDYKETGLDSMLPGLHQKLSELPDDWDIYLILDSLDECPYVLTHACLKDIHELVTVKRRIHYAIITRPMWYSLDQFADWQRFRLDAFAKEECELYLKKKLGWEPSQLSELYSAIEKQPGCEYLYTNPFFLSIFSEIVQPQTNDLPRRLQMVDSYVKHVVHRELKDMLPQLGVSAEENEKMAFLALGKVAFAIATDDKLQVDRLIKILVSRKAILEDTPSGIAFTHDLFKQFFLCLYLVSNCRDIIQLPQRQNGEWNGLLSFLFEYDHQDSLPPPIVEWAWSFDKLAVTFGLSSLEILNSLPIPELPEDPWLRGLLKAGRGGDATEETVEISEQRLSSPSYALEQRLKDPFLWYIGSLDNARATNIDNLISDNMEPWGELMPAIIEGNADWRKKLQGKSLFRFCLGLEDVRDQAVADRLGDLAIAAIDKGEEHPWVLALFLSRCAKADMNVLKWNGRLIQYLELVSTRRLHRLFVNKAFRGAVEQNNPNGDKLFDFVIARRKLIPELANVFSVEKRIKTALLPKIKAEMLNILSPIEMSLGVRKRLFTADEVPEAWKTYWAHRVGPIEAHKLLDAGILAADRIDQQKLTAWKGTLGPKEAAGLVEAKLLKGSDFNPQLVRRWLDESDRFELFRLFTTFTITSEISVYPEFVERAFATLPFDRCWYLVHNKKIIPEENIPQNFWERARQAMDSDPVAFAFMFTKGDVYANSIKARCKESAFKLGETDVRAIFLKKKVMSLEECWNYESASIEGIDKRIIDSILSDNVDASNFEINRELRDRPFTFVVIRKNLSTEGSFYVYHPFWNCDIRFSKQSGIPHDEIKEGSVIQSFVNVAFQGGIGLIDFRAHALNHWSTEEICQKYMQLIIRGDDKLKLENLRNEKLTYKIAQKGESDTKLGIPPFDFSQFKETEYTKQGKLSTEIIRKKVHDINSQLKNRWFTLCIAETNSERKTGIATHRNQNYKIKFSFENIIEEREISSGSWLFCRVQLQKTLQNDKWMFYVRDGAFLL